MRQSPSARKVWIEMFLSYIGMYYLAVAFRKEGVD